MKILNKLKKILIQIKEWFSHDCDEHKKLIGLESSNMFGKVKITKKTYRCQKCFKIWEEGKNGVKS